ncbi:disease resistance protein RGA2-like [Hordeum vulgare subsp. vulgare]|uniref:disease resistance protein RGA2-like n=1 Tax=Hordeum vulgare subsp. vulgare TaxID=112509 RepID=UPI001D1A4F11|nr:disease resistance protein RGA2-like [Hordeum vulgare subsp. vulgare]
MSTILITVLGWLVSPIIRWLLPKILVCLGFHASNKLLELEIHIIPELKKTMQTVDQERMMQRGKRVKTDVDALDKMAAMLRHALEDAEDIFDDAQHKIVLRCCHRLCGAFTACIALCKCCCVWIARVVRIKTAWLLQWARDSFSSLFLQRRSKEPVLLNLSAPVVSDEPVQVTIDILASDNEPDPTTTGAAASTEPDPVTTNAAVSHNEAVPETVTTGAAASDETDPVTTTTSDVASGDETVPVTANAASSDEPNPVTTNAEASDDKPDPVTTASYSLSGRCLSCLCSSLDFFKNCYISLYIWLAHVFEAACFYRDWSYQVVGIKKCQENASLFDIFLTAISRMKLKKRIQKVENTVREVKKSQLLGIESNSAPNDIANKNRSRIRAASKREVFGREVLRDDIMARLRETPQDGATSWRTSPFYSVIGIYGVAGSGKTTFARYICDYIKEECEENLFDTIMCIHVSETFSVDDIFHEMLKDITKDRHSDISDREDLVEKFKEALCGKRFFLVLDDVWVKNKHDPQMEELLSPLNVGLKGSKILVTARTKEAAGALCGDELIEMPDLDEDQYMKMFMHYALSGKSVTVKEFEQVGREIAKKLHRSLIAAVTVAGRLGANPNISFWKNVAKLDMLNDTLDALWWSYQQLNPDIRRCFELCNIFPRRFYLVKDQLVSLWIAEGFVKTSSATEEMEDVAEGYIQELVSCSFLQPEEASSNTEFFTIHDLLHDLVNKVAGSDCFRIENEMGQRGEGWKGDVPQDVRHLFIQNYDGELIPNKILGLENLRTLIINGVAWDTPVEEKVIESICMRLSKLRVLAICFGQYSQINNPNGEFLVPESIIQLKHLRYLAFRTSHYSKVILQSALAKLLHIQLLDFGYGKISDFMFADLINLRQILSYMSFPNIGTLTSLQTIPSFSVKNEDGYEIKQLRDLNKLRGKLTIFGLVNIESKKEALEANLAAKKRLMDLTLFFSGSNQQCSAEVEAEVLAGLCPPVGLEQLSIWYYNGSRYPDWIVGRLNGGPKDLQRLEFRNCRQLGPSPKLEAFPHLRRLCLVECSWDTLPGNMEHLTSLEILDIERCMNIRSLPTLPQSLKVFALWYCNMDLMKGCETEGDPNWHKIKHILHKHFDPRIPSQGFNVIVRPKRDRKKGRVNPVVYMVVLQHNWTCASVVSHARAPAVGADSWTAANVQVGEMRWCVLGSCVGGRQIWRGQPGRFGALSGEGRRSQPFLLLVLTARGEAAGTWWRPRTA